MAEMPAMNLSPQSTPWGKEMERRALASDTLIGQLQTTVSNLQSVVTSLIVPPPDASVPDGSITTPKLAAGAVTDAKVTDVAGSKVTGTVANATNAANSDGVSSAAYTRNAVGSGFFGVWMNSALQLMRNTSSIRYKKNRKNYSFGDRVLNLQPVEYDRIGGGHEYGLIAEEVLEHVPEIVTWYAEPELDEDGNPTGVLGEARIDGVRYDLLSVALLDAVKGLKAEIVTLQNKVN